MAKQILDFRPRKVLEEKESSVILRTAGTTVIRQYGRNKSYRTYCPQRRHLNFEVDGEKNITGVKNISLVCRVSEFLKSKGLENPNNAGKNPIARTMVVFKFSGSKERIREMAFGKQQVSWNPDAPFQLLRRNPEFESWAKQLRTFLELRYGKENVVAVIAHLDVALPDVMAVVLAVSSSNKFSYIEKFAGDDKFSYRQRNIDTHDQLYEQVNKHFGLERGERRSSSDGHFFTLTSYEFEMLQYISLNLQEKLDKLQQEKESIDVEEERLLESVKSKTTELANKKKRKAEIESKITSQKSQAEREKVINDEMEHRPQILYEELDKIISRIIETQQQLKSAREQLQDVADRRAELDEQAKDIEKKIKQDLPTLHEKTMRDVRSTGWKIFGEDSVEQINAIEKYIADLPEHKRNTFTKVLNHVFGDSMISTILSRPNEIAAVSAALFLGYIEQAKFFVDSHGGNSRKLDGEWMRDSADDDEAWRRKCFYMGIKMMHK